MKSRLLAIAVIIFFAGASVLAADLSYSDITARLYDLRLLAEIPDASERSGCFSSGDRRAQYNPETDRYEHWYSNDDWGGYVRKEADGIVAAEMEGPGVIWRVWSAQPESGLMKIYIDGAETPALAIPFREYFNNTKVPFNYPELVRDNARGMNSYVPIVYQRSCKVVLCEGWGRYYQITYSKLPAGTEVQSFDGTFGDEEQAALEKANQAWATMRKPHANTKTSELDEKLVVIAPGESIDIANYGEAGAITSLQVQMPGLSKGMAFYALRQLTLSMYWDGREKPAVWGPLGDIFGTAPGINKYNSLPLGMTEEGFYSNWYMPYRAARIVLTNDGAVSQTVAITIGRERISSEEAGGMLRFHAKWHRDNYAPYGRERMMTDRWPDWMVLYTNNTKGRFCGMMLHHWNPLHMWNRDLAKKYEWLVPDDPSFEPGSELNEFFHSEVIGHTYWWGEGDEKFFVDGEKMPSTYGTGTEDYFGYAWGTPARFESAVQCQTLNHDNTGHVSVCRWQIADNVPFQHSFEGSIEKYHDNNWPLRYAVTAYWYQLAGTDDPYDVIPVDERLGYFSQPVMKSEH